MCFGDKEFEIYNNWYKYNFKEEVNNWIHEFYRLKLADYNYLDNYKVYKYKKIEELSLEETLSYLTFIIRGEKFSDGHIASYLEDGTIERLGEKFFKN